MSDCVVKSSFWKLYKTKQNHLEIHKAHFLQTILSKPTSCTREKATPTPFEWIKALAVFGVTTLSRKLSRFQPPFSGYTIV